MFHHQGEWEQRLLKGTINVSDMSGCLKSSFDSNPSLFASDDIFKTAEDKGTFSDSKLTISDSIGFDGNQKDLFRFHIDTLGNLNLELRDLSANADMDIFDRDGNLIARSNSQGKTPELITHILESGDYFISVYPNSFGERTNYNLKIIEVNLSERVRPESENINLWRYDTNGRTAKSGGTYQGIEANKNTVVIIHGWNNNDQTRTIYDLAKKASDGNFQVICLDWGSISQAGLDWGAIPFATAKWITPVARWASERLLKLGINAGQLNIIGHSLGSYISSELASFFGSVNQIVALDPAYPTNDYDIDINEPGYQTPKNFKDVAATSLAFVASDDNSNGTPGDNNKAATASDSLILKFNVETLATHGGVIDVFTNLLSQNFINLQDLNLPKHEKNWYNNNGDKDNWLDKMSHPDQHEGVMYVNWDSSSSDYSQNHWRINELRIVIDASGNEQVIQMGILSDFA